MVLKVPVYSINRTFLDAIAIKDFKDVTAVFKILNSTIMLQILKQ